MPLEAHAVGYRYGAGPWVIRDLDLSVAPGEIVGLHGPSGRGKSTFARLLAGHTVPREGRVTVARSPLPGSGYCPVQLVSQHPESAVNPRWRMRDTLGEAGPVDRTLTDALGIDPAWLDRYPNELSSGELQRFCAARALVGETRYLVADEMTTMLDPITRAQIWHVVLGAVESRGLGVLMISHERALVDRLCGRVVELE